MTASEGRELSGVKLEDQLSLVTRLQGECRIVAMGTGTYVAMNSSQVTLLKGDLRGIAQARTISDETVSNMKQNLARLCLQRAGHLAGRR